MRKGASEPSPRRDATGAFALHRRARRQVGREPEQRATWRSTRRERAPLRMRFDRRATSPWSRGVRKSGRIGSGPRTRAAVAG